MSHLAKLTIKSVPQPDISDPVQTRRNKLLAGIEEQLKVVEAAIAGKQHVISVERWVKNELGERVRVNRQRVSRAWFMARNDGYYVQCRYGSRALPLSKDGNAVFVKKITEISTLLQTFFAAASAGEFDAAIGSVAHRGPKSVESQ